MTLKRDVEAPVKWRESEKVEKRKSGGGNTEPCS